MAIMSSILFTNTLICRLRRTLFAATLTALAATPVFALNIVMTDDDGFETNNIQALFTALKAAGHDVIMSAPYSNQSGASAQVAVMAPISPTTKASARGKLPAGSYGTGPTTIAADQYYVDGTPVAAVMYGIDVLAKAKWGKVPDLVISGPNVGPNVGAVTPHSGTVGAAISAINKGIPAFAVNAANDDAATTALVCQITLRVLNATLSQGKVNLPPGTGLNVNIPKLDSKKSATDYHYVFTQVGTGADYGLLFYQHLGESPLAVSYGIPASTTLPGVSVASPSSAAGYPVDSNPTSETNVLLGSSGAVTVSPIQGTYQASSEKAATVFQQMGALFPDSTVVNNLKMSSISSRSIVGTGDQVQIMGFVISGTTPKTVLIRAAGPSLASFGLKGLLTDPMIELYNDKQAVAGSNDNWSDDATQTTAIEAVVSRVGAWPWTRGSKDAALLTTLNPGVYTVIVKGQGSTTGIALIEVLDAMAN